VQRTTLAVCLALPLAASCYSFNAPATVRTRHSIETHCPDDQVTVQDVGNDRFRAIGCGQRATYACFPRSAGSEEWDCRREEEQDPGTVFGTTAGGEQGQQVRDSSHVDAGVDAGLAHDAGAAPAVDAGAAAVVTPPAGDAPTAVRAAIAGHSADILGCTGRTSIGVHASWDAHGVVTFGLPGDLAGRPEESCVRTAIGPLTVAPPAGELMELVRR